MLLSTAPAARRFSRPDRGAAALKQAGADQVHSGEGEVALAFIEDIADRLGATPEQIDRERARTHRELPVGA